jgi:WD40 repeat protein
MNMWRSGEGFSLVCFIAVLGCPAVGVVCAEAQNLDVLWTAEHGAQVGAVVFSPDTTLVVSGSQLAYGSEAFARLWDVATGQPVDSYTDYGPNDSILGVAISAPHQRLAVGYSNSDFYNGYARTNVYDIAQHALIAQYAGAHVSFSADGQLLATGGGYFVRNVAVHSVETGELVENVYTGDYVRSLALAPDATYFAAGATSPSSVVRVWSVPGGELLHTLSGAGATIASVAISPDSTLIAAGAGEPQGGDGAIRVYSAGTGALVHYLPGHAARTLAVAFAPDGRKLLSFGAEQQVGGQTTLKLWRLADETLLATYEDVGGDVHYARDGSAIVYASGSQVVVARTPGGIVGDLNCDGAVDFGDINPFVLALWGRGPYEQAYPSCDYFNADVNGNGHVGFEDVNRFVTLVGGT